MSLEVKLTCNANGCYRSKELFNVSIDDLHVIEDEYLNPTGRWLADPENDTHYCPGHAKQAAEELGLTYDPS